MSIIRGAILAVLLILAAGPLSEPRQVRFRLADGVRVAGALTFWDAEGIDGSFGRRLWVELMPGDAWRLYLSVMDQKDAHQWVDLGRVLLQSEGGDAWAERAFQQAIRSGACHYFTNVLGPGAGPGFDAKLHLGAAPHAGGAQTCR